MKRIYLALAAIGLTTGALAALPAATDPTVINVPQLSGGFFFGASGYYLQPSDSHGDLDYAAVNFLTTGANSNTRTEIKNVEPGYDWAWGLSAGYIFPGTGNDVSVNFFQLQTTDESYTSVTPGATASIALPDLGGITFLPVSSGEDNIANVKASAQYSLNQVDLTAGQYVNIGCRLSVHPYAGMRWAGLDRRLKTDATATHLVFTVFNTPVDTSAEQQESDFTGLGPIIGTDGSYYIGNGFGIVAHGDGAVLIGDIQDTANVTQDHWITVLVNGQPFTFVQEVQSNNETASTRRIVPVMDGKLGINYTYLFNDASNSDLTLEVGWQWDHYFNAIDKIQLTSAASQQQAPQQQQAGQYVIASHRTSDFGINGPYISLIYHI